MNKRLRIRHLSTQKSLVGIVGITIIISLSWLVVMCHYDFFQEAYAQIQNQSVQTSIPDLKSPRVAYLTDGHFSDAGWGAFAYNAGQEIISKYGYEVSFLDNVSISNIETTLKSYAVKDYDIIIAQGYEWGDPVIKVAKEYPDIKFVVLHVNSTTKVLVTYLSDWDNETKGKLAALSQIEQGADFILHVADTSGQGVINAAKEKGIYAFGAVSDQNKLAPDTVVTSFVLDPIKAYDSVFNMISMNNFTGTIFTPGLESTKNSTTEDGIIYIAPFYGFQNKIPKDIQAKFIQLSQDIRNKKIIVSE